MAETAATGTVRLSFLSSESISDEAWTLFTKGLERRLGQSGFTSFGSERVPGAHYDVRVSYARTFDNEKQFVDTARALIENFQAEGRIPRSVHAAHAEYWLGRMEKPQVYWHTTIDLAGGQGREG